MLEQACILAAGQGLRLGPRDYPKGFLRLGARTLIEDSLDRLWRAGIQEVVLVTGHLREHYEGLGDPRLRLVHNPEFGSTGSLASLRRAAPILSGDFLLLESDLAYEDRALRRLLEDGRPDLVLVSGLTGAGDEVWVDAPGGRLRGLSKRRSELGPDILGEFVGITRISSDLLQTMLAQAGPDYETDALAACARLRAVECLLIEDLIWCEVDDQSQLERARSVIYPRLLKGSGG